MTRILIALLLAAAALWAGHAQAADDAMIRHGKQVFERSCASCHAPGERMPGTASLAAKYDGSLPAALEQRKDMSLEFIRYYVRNGVLVMPPFRKVEVSDADLEAMAAYLNSK